MSDGTCRIGTADDSEEFGESYIVWDECDRCGYRYPCFGLLVGARYCCGCGRRIVNNGDE